MSFRRRYEAFDRYQQRHGWLGFPLAVRQKYSDDQGGYLAATITYYAFFAVFPLLLVLVSVLGFVLKGHPELQRSIVDSALGQFPVIGRELKVGALHGSALALVFGIAASMWAGMGVFLAAQNAMNRLWGIPFSRRPDVVRARGRALLLLLVLGGGTLGTAVLGSLATAGAQFGLVWKIASIILATALDFLLFWVGFRLLVTHALSWRTVRGGAIAAAIGYELLQIGGGYYVAHVLKNANNTYGTFGLVIGLLSWIYLASHITLLAAEGNVVAGRHLWPRSFSVVLEQPSTGADREALRQRSQTEERRGDQQTSVSFRPRRAPSAAGPRGDRPRSTPWSRAARAVRLRRLRG